MDHKISDMPTRSTPDDGLFVGHHWDFPEWQLTGTKLAKADIRNTRAINFATASVWA